MRWWIGIVIVIVIIAALIYITQEEPAPTSTQTTTTTATQTQAPEPAPTEEAATPDPAATQAAAQPRQPAQPAVDDVLERIKQVAAQNRVQIVGWQRGGSGAIIKLQWIGDSSGPGGDFINDLLRQGIIRSADDPQQGVGFNRQQQRVYWTQWRLSF